eukprot:TRINITY_DN519_c1_g1_i2.p1 TRINITY_DN519_c1_g1~~TRINITY_DN519_c1_g1_i2.p1  ORF type:complete len:261 (-),score=24.27 TRINITY_DN519_c1_g1_i2:264-1046(-)
MRRLNSTQNQKVSQVIEITGISRDEAVQYLQSCNWEVQTAINACFNEQPPGHVNTRPSSQKFSSSAADNLFNKYKSEGANMILAEGILRLCEDLQINPTDPVLIVLSYYMEAETNCEFSREEFVKGLRAIKCDSINKLKNDLPRLRSLLKDSRLFSDIYRFTYKWACAKGKRFLDINTAIGMWQLLFSEGRQWSHLEKWLEFVQKSSQGRQVIPQDTWQQLIEFINTYGDDYSSYDAENGAWPVLIDEFVEYMTEQEQQQ